jgi:hypothetical protein
MAADSGGASSVLILLLVLLLAGGGWNYHSNSQLENATYRPFRSYSDTDLEMLLAQYQGQMDTHSERYEKVAEQTVQVRARGHLGGQSEKRSGSPGLQDDPQAIAHLWGSLI